MIVGYQSQGSLGRRLVEGEPLVSIHGEKIAVKAQIHTLGGFSAHAGQTDLLPGSSAITPSKPRVVLTHGEKRAAPDSRAEDSTTFQTQVRPPGMGDVIEI